MANSDELTTRLIDLSRVLVAEETLDDTLARVASMSTSLIEACDSCGVSLVNDGEVSTRHATNERADRVDEIQYSTGEGPCLSAIEEGRAIQVPSFDDEQRWPEFIRQAIEEGITASYSVPLRVESDIVGSLNLYSNHAPFSETDQQVGRLLAAQAAVALRNAQTFNEVTVLVDQLNEALASRDVIGQAKGMLMARHGVPADEAFGLLRRESQHRNVKLRDLAAQVVARETTIDIEGGR